MPTEYISPMETLSIDQAVTWIAELFEENPSTLRAGTARADIAAWDLLGQLILMPALDQRYGIRLNQAELASLASVQDILDILARNDRLLDS